MCRGAAIGAQPFHIVDHTPATLVPSSRRTDTARRSSTLNVGTLARNSACYPEVAELDAAWAPHRSIAVLLSGSAWRCEGVRHGPDRRLRTVLDANFPQDGLQMNFDGRFR